MRSGAVGQLCSLLIVGLLVMIGSVQAQEPVDTVSSYSGIEIVTSVDRAEIYVGDLITYKVTITYDSSFELVPPPLGANLGAFDVKDYQTDIISTLPDGRMQSENIFKLSTFTTGDYVIPPLPALFNLPDSTRKIVLSEGVPIKVLSLLENAGDSLDIRPVKPQYEFTRDLRPYYMWGGLAFLLLLLAGVLVWKRMRRGVAASEPVDNRPAWEIAFERLAQVKQKDWLTEGEFKLYYIELTEILRTFHERMYSLNVMDMTTDEFLTAFETRLLPDGLFDRTAKFFRGADLVKFAKFIPEVEQVESDFDEAHDMIELVRADFERETSSSLAAGRPVNSVEADEVKS